MIRAFLQYLSYIRFKVLQCRAKRRARKKDPDIYPLW
jgi:hypothetical protein